VESAVDKEILRELKKVAVGEKGDAGVVVNLLRNRKGINVSEVDWKRRLQEVEECRLGAGDVKVFV